MITKVVGPDGQQLTGQKVILTDEGNGKHGVVYKPAKVGTYKIHVTVGLISAMLITFDVCVAV